MALSLAPQEVPLDQDGDGVLRVGGTRVTLDTIVAAYLDGCTAEEVVDQYPSLDLADVYAVIGYYLRHRDEVRAYLLDRQRQQDEARRQNLARCAPSGVRDRLMARRPAEQAD